MSQKLYNVLFYKSDSQRCRRAVSTALGKRCGCDVLRKEQEIKRCHNLEILQDSCYVFNNSRIKA
jgi:hypothetical protein